jgi:hypothetical protein
VIQGTAPDNGGVRKATGYEHQELKTRYPASGWREAVEATRLSDLIRTCGNPARSRLTRGPPVTFLWELLVN